MPKTLQKPNDTHQLRCFLPVQLSELQEAEKTSTIQLMRPGKWDHAWYGDFEITAADVSEFVRNFNDNIRRQELPIDVDHCREKAAGWIKELYDQGKDGLFALVKWTEYGLGLVQGEEYKYISADFNTKFKDPETGKEYTNVLNCASLVNFPFIKDMAKVELSENDMTEGVMVTLKSKQEDKGMNEILKKLGVKTEEEAIAKLNDMSVVPEGKEIVDSAELAEIKTKAAKLSKTEKSEKTLADRVAHLEKEAKSNEFERLFDEHLQAGKVTPAQKETYKSLFELDPAKVKELMENSAQILKTGETGAPGSGQEDGVVSLDEAEKQVVEKVRELMEKEGLSASDARKKVFADHPELKEPIVHEIEGE